MPLGGVASDARARTPLETHGMPSAPRSYRNSNRQEPCSVRSPGAQAEGEGRGAIGTFVIGRLPRPPDQLHHPFDPGGESDVSARLQQPYFKEITGQDLIIQYLPGAGGAQAWAGLNDQEGDGYTIMGTNLPHIILQPLLQDPGYATEDITNVYMFHFTPDALIVRQDSPYQTLEDIIAAANENPGAITASGSGTNSANHIANQIFENETGAQLTYIPYSGTAPSVTAVLGGETDAAWGYTTVAARQPELKMLAVATEERHPLFPDVPTFQELGYDIVGGAYRGIAVPDERVGGDPPGGVRRHREINADPDFIQQMVDGGFAMIDVPYSDGRLDAGAPGALPGVAEQLAAGG
jgi:tripartite-type tricarboxylate transporter receptor subunit TctC